MATCKKANKNTDKTIVKQSVNKNVLTVQYIFPEEDRNEISTTPLRAPRWILDKLDALCRERHGKLSRNSLIVEILADAIS